MSITRARENFYQILDKFDCVNFILCMQYCFIVEILYSKHFIQVIWRIAFDI